MLKGNYLRSIIVISLLVILSTLISTGCSGVTKSASQVDQSATISIGNKLAQNQPTPTDIEYSLERYNLIRRAYWVNGQREKARSIPQPIPDIPLGYCVLFTESGAVVGSYIVDGKVTSLNSYLSPDSEAYEGTPSSMLGTRDNGSTHTIGSAANKWLPDVDGSYGENDNGIFFFTPDGKYIEWTGIYLYSDIPFIVADPILKVDSQ